MSGTDTQPRADFEDLVVDRSGNGERFCRGHIGEVGGDVVGGRAAARLGHPPVTEADEDPRETAAARRVVLVAELAGSTGQIDHDRDDELGPYRLEEPALLEGFRIA